MGTDNNKEASAMPTYKALLLNVLFIGSLIGFDCSHAAGDLTRRTQALPDLRFGSEESDYAVSQKEYQLETGVAYQLKVSSDGQKECAFQAPEFAKSIFLRKVEAGGVEIKAITLVELEFEDAGEAEIFFLPVKPGSYPFYCKGLEGKGMEGRFVVKWGDTRRWLNSGGSRYVRALASEPAGGTVLRPRGDGLPGCAAAPGEPRRAARTGCRGGRGCLPRRDGRARSRHLAPRAYR